MIAECDMEKAGRPKGTVKFNDLSNPWQRFRAVTGMSQAALAGLIEVAQQTICQYESGERFPHPFYAKRFVILCKARRIRCSMDEVYDKLSVD